MNTRSAPHDPSRRDLLKDITRVGAIATSAGLLTPVPAKAEDSCVHSGAEEPAYMPPPPHAPAEEGVVALSGGAGLYYWDTGGTGPAVVLCHPGRGSALSWPYQQAAFASAGFRTIAYSRRGHYGSPAGSDDDSGTFAGDLDTLITHLGVKKFHIIGLAAGGFTVSDYAVSYPEKLLSITIACSLFGLWAKDIDTRSDFILSKGFSALPPEFKELGPSYRWAYPDGVREWIKMEESARDTANRVRQSSKNTVTWDKMRAVGAPFFFVAGGADLYQPPSMMRAAARQLPGSKTLVLPEAGHAVQWEQPAAFNRAVITFMRAHT